MTLVHRVRMLLHEHLCSAVRSAAAAGELVVWVPCRTMTLVHRVRTLLHEHLCLAVRRATAAGEPLRVCVGGGL
jgi:hypothetical protein